MEVITVSSNTEKLEEREPRFNKQLFPKKNQARAFK